AGSALPRRTPGATKAAAAAAAGASADAVAPAPAGAAEPRSAGLFSGFRARRADAASAAGSGTPGSGPAAARDVERAPGAAAYQPDRAEAPEVEEHHRPAVGAAALTILPDARGGRGRRSRGGRAQAEPVQPMTHRELRRLEHDDSDETRAETWAEPAPSRQRTEQPEQATSVFGSTDRAPARPAEPARASDSFAPQRTSSGATLPTRSSADRLGTSSDTVGTPAPSRHDALRQRSALASEALTELSLLSAYSPSSVESKPASTLTRRTPATPAAAVPPNRPAAPARRSRSASDVRSMLSGFQAGLERGRSGGEPAVRPDADDQHDRTDRSNIARPN
ncbi:MAG: hypothetical protein ACLGIA_10135, partial [Actinomycetes bacterium]